MTGSIGWPSPAPRLHIDDCFEIRNCRLGPCDLLLSRHRNFLHEVRLRHSVFCTGPLLFWSSDRSRNFGLWVKWVQTLCLPKSSRLLHVGLWRYFMRKTGVRVPVFRICHPRDSLNSCSHSGMSEQNGSPRTCSWFSFVFSFGVLVGLGNNGSPRSFRLTCELDTSTGWMSIPLRSSLSRLSLSLNTVVVGEVDELEKDVEQCLSYLEGVIEVERWEPEEELVNKPGTTIGTKFSVLHCIRILFQMRCRWSTHKNIRFHRKALRAIRLRTYSRGLS